MGNLLAQLIDNETESKTIHPSFIGTITKRDLVKKKLSGIKHKIGIYSAKGGVGKTTISINMAYTLKDKGYKVGLLDADIDCPNIPLALGITDKINATRLPIDTYKKDGLEISSTGMLVGDIEKPIIWRGPIVAKMIDDFLINTKWSEDLDYLIIDLPPGTSDSPLSIMQLLDLDGIILVNTPQRIASENSIRAGLMAKRMNIHIYGVIENMSGEDASKFTEDVLNKLDTKLLGKIPYDKKFDELSDESAVGVEADPSINERFSSIINNLINK